MNHRYKSHRTTRRTFLREGACASLGLAGLVNALAQLRLITAAMAQGLSSPSYKALVCLFLNGGNDSNNLLIPAGDPASDPLRADYERGRSILAIPHESLHSIAVPENTEAFKRHHGNLLPAMGIHPLAPELAGLFDAGDLAFICNVGTLAYPVPSRQDYLDRAVPLPIQLFSHLDQISQWQSSVADKPTTSGWGGRAAELLHASYNDPASSKVSMSISLDGMSSFQTGTAGDLIQYIVRPDGSLSLSGFDQFANDGIPYDAAINPDGSYKNTDPGKRLKCFDDIMHQAHSNLHEEAYCEIITRARATEGVIGAALTGSASSGVDFDGIFSNADTRLGRQLKTVAKLIASRSILGNNRQIFFCQMSGYDTHQTLLGTHADLLQELAGSMKAFRDALQALGVWNDVTTFTASDFNRTFNPNSTDPATAGSDHAWGGHAMVMGGAVRGGRIYGHFPSLKTGSAEGSVDTGSQRGQWIPDISVDQYSAVLASWMGAGSNELEAIFPNLHRFDDPFTVASANMNFL
ncbi:DUF1501 domain-containing protein [Luteolibacter marinus]|uniref:DUF1501 domain-containing protein n=1 Tax=Luteolibacter marinus TaxID=2776705 RepID=UPI0018684D35|nr:DUF1501 domain-containing protein [Luteolibacter marinus]